MPIKLPDGLPAKAVLEKENVFVMDENRAFHQDIRPLRIVIANLMPLKEATETQLLRLLGNTPLQLEVTLLKMESYASKNTPLQHMEMFYQTFPEIQHRKYDGMIVTGAPIEHLDFEEVEYWHELERVMDWSVSNVTSSLHICWGAQAALYHHYGIQKHPLREKMFGVFSHTVLTQTPLVRGFDEGFLAPHSRHTEVRAEDVITHPELLLVSESEDAGAYIMMRRDGTQIFVTGHSEYDRYTLQQEYLRDVQRGAKIQLPKNYFPGDDPTKSPQHNWRSHAHLLFSNWLNYYVYQETPYNLDDIGVGELRVPTTKPPATGPGL